MVENDKRFFVDRRTDEEKKMGLATPIRYWYDLDRKKRQRTNGVAVTLTGEVVVARSTCSRTDQFSRRHGRMVVAGRIQGRQKAARLNRARGIIHCWIIPSCYMVPVLEMATNTGLQIFPLFWLERALEPWIPDRTSYMIQILHWQTYI